MELHIATVSVMTAVVVITAGLVFIAETVLREADTVGRLWSIGFLAGILSSSSYAVWAFTPDVWGAVAIGNAAFVASSGFMWLGCRRFNERRAGWAEAVVATLVLGSALAVVVRGPDGGNWAGSEVMFLSLMLLPGAAAAETVRGAFAGIRTSIGLAVVFGIQSLFYASRLIVLFATGSESEAFLVWWGTIPTSILTIVLTIVVVVIASVLRAERAGLRGRRRFAAPDVGFGGLLDPPWFEHAVADAIERGAARAESIAVVSTRIDDLDLVTTAFGASETDGLRTAWCEAMRLHAPTQAWIGSDREGGIALCSVVESEADARRLGALLHQAIYDSLGDVEASVIPLLGVGVALSGPDRDAPALIASARAAAAEAALSDDTSVVVAS